MTKTNVLITLLVLLCLQTNAQEPAYNLKFDKLATSWDEAIPLGNGMLGALIWEKDGKLRFSLDRADLWDSRPMNGLHRKEFSFDWVQAQVAKKDYKPVQQYFDWPYDNEPAPTKIPGAALEINMGHWGRVKSVELHLQSALCEVNWENGCRLTSFVSANKAAGFFKFENAGSGFKIDLIAPRYSGVVTTSGDPVGGDDLSRLGYQQGKTVTTSNSISYLQEGWGGFKYRVSVHWKKAANTIEGAWTISAATNKILGDDAPVLQQYLRQSYPALFAAHQNWWKKYWSKSDLQVPDSMLQKQWYMEQYKFGSASRKGAPPVSLQAVWTADNGRIPPWKGDYHHDLNTQLSYWPSYSANHMEEAMVYLDHLTQNKANYKRYTRAYFDKPGLNVPGVTTLNGTEMGGWIQYSFSPTVAAWLSQHFYLQWRYSMDRKFLQTTVWPWIKEVAIFLEQLTKKDANGYRQLPLSSSPEINDNSIDAWFTQNTNYDLALMKFNFTKAVEVAKELGLQQEASHWQKVLNELPGYALSANNELMFAPSMPYNVSHRHFSNVMAIHPLGLIKWEDDDTAKSIIKNSIHLLDSIGSANWCGYSFSWLANLKARAKDGEGAATALQIFAKAFCSVNSFHLNGDQTKSGYSTFTYRPFTLEGNFAFAAGLQEMLLQSHAGFIEVMPAVPARWNDISFNSLRAEGAFLVSAKKESGAIKSVTIVAEKGGIAKLKLPFAKYTTTAVGNAAIVTTDGEFVTIKFAAGASLKIVATD